jgi:hypothetical protein
MISVLVNSLFCQIAGFTLNALVIIPAQVSEHPWFLQNLPPDALSMNENFLNHANFTGVQTVEEIQAILRTAQTPGPGECRRFLLERI